MFWWSNPHQNSRDSIVWCIRVTFVSKMQCIVLLNIFWLGVLREECLDKIKSPPKESQTPKDIALPGKILGFMPFFVISMGFFFFK